MISEASTGGADGAARGDAPQTRNLPAADSGEVFTTSTFHDLESLLADAWADAPLETAIVDIHAHELYFDRELVLQPSQRAHLTSSMTYADITGVMHYTTLLCGKLAPRFFYVHGNASLTLELLALSGGHAGEADCKPFPCQSSAGGVLYMNNAALNVVQCALYDNSAYVRSRAAAAATPRAATEEEEKEKELIARPALRPGRRARARVR